MNVQTTTQKARSLKVTDVRTLAVKTLTIVLQQKSSLTHVLPEAVAKLEGPDRGLLQELCYGTLRWHPQLQGYIDILLEKPLRNKDCDIQAALLMGIYQLKYTRIPDHAAISATVDVAKQLQKHWASKLINGVLRRFQRQQTDLTNTLCHQDTFQFAHPRWLIDSIRHAWPDRAEAIFTANNAHPPFTLRLNTNKLARRRYLESFNMEKYSALETPLSCCGVSLEPAPAVEQLPGFNEGTVSVQDEAAQLAAPLLQLAPGQRVLDACCAPGGKTGHILELEPALRQLIAIDKEKKRLARVEENLTRLNVAATLICGSAAAPQTWWDGELFDRILVDAPCSATGVIRRHPDIKLLRNSADIAKLAKLQTTLLQALWPLLAPGGILLYATCSIMPQENAHVIEQFLALHVDAQHDSIAGDGAFQSAAADPGIAQRFGWQLLPLINGHDGFYYARLRKKETAR